MRAVSRTIRAARRPSGLFRTAAVLALWSVASGLPLQAKRADDVLIMKGGDRFTGEIKKLENGILYFKAGYMLESLQLDWTRVERLKSKDQYTVSIRGIRRTNGLIGVDSGTPGFALQAGGAERRVLLADVIEIVPVEGVFWAQLAGSIDYGFSFTSGNNTAQSSLSAQATYLAESWGVRMTGSSVFNSQTDSPRSGRNNLDFLYTKALNERWFAGATATLLNSEQQDLTLRITGGGAVGRDFVRSGTSGLLALAGVVFSREQYSSFADGQLQKQVEAQFQVRVFKSTFKTMQFNATLAAYPNLTTLGRVRLSAESYVKVELVKGLYSKVSVYENYDNRPPGNAPKNDFGTTTSFGWSF
jgi:hypothetical protein